MTPREYMNALRRILQERLSGIEIEIPPCPRCFSGNKVVRVQFGKYAGNLAKRLMFRDAFPCFTCAFREIKQTEAELTQKEFETQRIRLVRGGPDGIYRYRPCLLRRRKSINHNHHPQ